MNSGLQKRLYEMEVLPPAAVWENLSLSIDEINTDNAVAKKMLVAELHPPAKAWENINSAINVVEKKQPIRKPLIINLRRLAAAAVFIGIIVTAWLLFRNSNQRAGELAVQKTGENKTSADTNAIQPETNTAKESDSPPVDSIASVTPRSPNEKNKRNKTPGTKSNTIVNAQLVKGQSAVLNKAPLEKSFDKPIDDLSLITADQHYMTMVNANGRLSKIPVEFAHLAPHLQDKPISEDIYEIMFGEGTYWKETLNAWRRKVASAPVSSGDAFTSLIELLKTVEDK